MKFSAIPLMLSMIPRVLRGVEVRDIEVIKQLTRKVYPEVQQITTGMLEQRMESPGSLLLVDVRSSEEFAISHLPGAIRLGSAAQIADELQRRKSSEAVLYCSVGFRSSMLAHVLAVRGVEGVANLDGSIFEWANEGRPLCRGEALVYHVHPFSKRWAGLLKPGLASDE